MKKLSIFFIWVIVSGSLFGQASDSLASDTNNPYAPDSLTGDIAIEELVKELTKDRTEEQVWLIHDSKTFSHTVTTHGEEAIYTLIVIFEEKNGIPNAMAIAYRNGRKNYVYPKEPISSIPNGFNIQLLKFRALPDFTKFTVSGGYVKKRRKGTVWAALLRGKD